ncbi:MAG TPA: MFS transporter [Terriglobia bacterium]|jgi:MFS family permease|nr:MFS transporter [Terriglobia bacterium]
MPDVSQADARGGSTRWTIVGLLFAASLINYVDRSTISLALPLIGHDLRLGPETKGVLLSSFFWSYALMQVPIGWAADRVNLRWLYAAAFAVWSLAQGLTGFAGSLAALMLFRVLLGIGESIYLPGGTKIVSVLFAPRERGLPCGLFDFGTRMGLVLGGLTIPWLLVHLGWRVAFRLVGFAGLLWLVPWILATPRRIGQSQQQPRTGAPPMQGVRALVRNRNLVGICLGFFCFDYYWYLLVNWLPDYLVTVRHFTLLGAGFFAALPFLVFGASEPVGGWLADRLIRRGWDETRTRKGIVTVAFLTGLLLIPASRVASAGAAVALIAGGSLVGLATGNLLVILQCCAPSDEVGLWTGFENLFGNAAGVLAPIVTGLIISRTGSYAPGFALAAITLLVGLLCYWFIVGDLGPKVWSSNS